MLNKTEDCYKSMNFSKKLSKCGEKLSILQGLYRCEV
jgi:hypothetical protein